MCMKCEAFYRKPHIVSKTHNVSPTGSTGSSLFCYFLFWYISELLRLPRGWERHWPGVGNQHLHTADGDKHCPVCHRSRLRHHGLQQWSLRGGGSLAREAPWQSSAQDALQVGYRFWPPTVHTVNTITSCVLSFALYLHPSPLVHHLGGTTVSFRLREWWLMCPGKSPNLPEMHYSTASGTPGLRSKPP